MASPPRRSTRVAARVLAVLIAGGWAARAAELFNLISPTRADYQKGSRGATVIPRPPVPNAAARSDHQFTDHHLTDHQLNPPHSRHLIASRSIGAAFVLTAAAWAWMELGRGRWWHGWTSGAAIGVAAAAVCLAYGIGVAKGAGADRPNQRWSHAAFAAGIGTVLLALEPPLAELARRLFLVRQIDDVLLGIVAPILIMLAAPVPVLVGGLRAPALRSAIANTDDAKGRGIDVPGKAVLATALFIGVLTAWLYPQFQDTAVASAASQAMLEGSMLAAGLLFWSRIFDFRPLAAEAGYGKRLMMLWITSLVHIGIGAYLTMKSEILYPAYGATERLFGIAALTDETVGGFIFWVPSAILCLAAAILVLHLWGRHEDRVWAEYSTWSPSNSAILAFPTTAAELIARARPKNRSLAVAVAAFAVAVFGLTIFSGVLNHLNASRGSMHTRRSLTSREPYSTRLLPRPRE